MTRVSKCSAFCQSMLPDTPLEMAEFAVSNNIPAMADEAVTMAWSATTVRVASHLTVLLFIGSEICATRESRTGERVCVVLNKINVAVGLYALKKLYDSASYLQASANRFPGLYVRLFGV